MPKATPGSLTEKERSLLAETRRDRLASLGEDELLDLLARVRRARGKFVQQHRREVATHIESTASRGAASAPPRRSASKAEVFEEALARVSSAVAAAARRAAADLKAERLGTAAKPGRPAPAHKPAADAASTPGPAPRPGSRKAVASTRAEGARRQAKRDAK
jgi:hypothetical protein